MKTLIFYLVNFAIYPLLWYAAYILASLEIIPRNQVRLGEIYSVDIDIDLWGLIFSIGLSCAAPFVARAVIGKPVCFTLAANVLFLIDALILYCIFDTMK